MGFCCKILSLNDLTLSPISRPGTRWLPISNAEPSAHENELLKIYEARRVHWKFTQWKFTTTTSQRACKPAMTTQAFSRRKQHRAKALCWKSGGRKKVCLGDAWVSFHPTDVVNLAWEVRFWKKFTFNRAQDVVRKPLVYSAHCGPCWLQGSYSNFAREISRAIFAQGGVGRHVVPSDATLSCHNWKRNDFRYSGAYFIC